tara:strand:+ start:4460 stop:4774 length:315 start_codon:yes stop_codon:yes gene_type:complete
MKSEYLLLKCYLVLVASLLAFLTFFLSPFVGFMLAATAIFFGKYYAVIGEQLNMSSATKIANAGSIIGWVYLTICILGTIILLAVSASFSSSLLSSISAPGSWL